MTRLDFRDGAQEHDQVNVVGHDDETIHDHRRKPALNIANRAFYDGSGGRHHDQIAIDFPEQAATQTVTKYAPGLA